ncbi:putative endopeptidase [Actinobaculum suis]|uniref:M13-type metalloendopeptidase n=1 Tax=Actinobaculum suis TaxID=1657 RepID=A0A1G6ZQ29_9ACTO|nr:M13-type metalloendopeptidase [Actinobaculum suis]MDY5153976.1 M13-type metalloendopeptidase [Actinobaculum suis]SDE03955.1 putative endopeptidase [Actinobaculum suis]
MTQKQMEQVLSGRDSQVRFQDDLFRAVNGKWLDTEEIPADEVRIGSFMKLRDEAEEHVREIIEEIDASDPEAEASKVKNLYSSWMDTNSANEKGNRPILSYLNMVAAAPDKRALATCIGKLMRGGVGTFFGIGVDSSFADPDLNVVHMWQSGLGLPDEAYYREAQFAPVFEDYLDFMPELFALGLGIESAQASRYANAVIRFERKIAAHHLNIVDSRNVDLLNNPMTFDQFTARAPGFDWAGALTAAGYDVKNLGTITVLTPDALAGAAAAWESAPLKDLKIYTSWQILRAYATFLSEEIDNMYFSFYGTVLSGASEQRDRWKRGVGLVNAMIGEGAGKLYVAKYFPPEAKAKMQGLVEDLLEAYRRSIRDLDWMSEETKQRALAKIDTFTPKIGYPQQWKDYSAVSVGDDLVANVAALHEYEFQRSIEKLGKPVDKSEWFMNPQEVNAYYNPQWNEIVFPAAILQFPFFDPDRDDALNYGGIGAVIGHEIGHGFDDQGSKYDETGALENWWTDKDRTEFEKRTHALVAQYNAYKPEQFEANSKFYVNGELTLGENIGDLGGLSIAFKAYLIHLERKGLTLDTAPVIDGFTAAQRVFLSYARIWQEKVRTEFLERQIATDPHSPGEFRCNGVVKNVDAFVQAFNVQESDALYLDPAERVRIW